MSADFHYQVVDHAGIRTVITALRMGRRILIVVPPSLPHHRAYGSVHGCSSEVDKTFPLVEETDEPKLT